MPASRGCLPRHGRRLEIICGLIKVVTTISSLPGMKLNKTLLVQKLKALGVHLTISVALVGIALWLMLRLWFPTPLFTTDGGSLGLKLLLVVDLVLGPMLTFVVFNPQKARRLMVLDLSVIAILQLGAYGYGLSNIHSVRVQAVAFHDGQFHSVTADRFAEQEIKPSDWQALGTGAPYIVNVREPLPGDESSGVFAFGFTVGLEPHQLQFLYTPLRSAADTVWQAGSSLAEVRAQRPVLANTAQRWLEKQGQSAEAVRFLRLQGFYDAAVLVINQRGEWLGGFAGDLPALVAPAKSPAKP